MEKKYPIGSNVTAEVRNLTNYGAFVEIEPGVDGLIHISDISWVKEVSHPSEVFKKGDKVSAVVLSVDRDNKRITLGIKQLSKNPWEDIQKVMPIGSLVKGVVTKVTAFGAFVQLENGMKGLIHVSELSDKLFGKVEEVISEGQEVTARVIKIDPESNKISLSIKENKENQDDIVVGEKKKRSTKKKTKEPAAEKVSDE